MNHNKYIDLLLEKTDKNLRILYHGTMDKNFKLTDTPIFLAKSEDEAATYAGGGYEWMTGKQKEGHVIQFRAKPGKTLDLNNSTIKAKVFLDMYGSPELKSYYDKIPDSYSYLTDDFDEKTIHPKESYNQLDTWSNLEFQSDPKIHKGMKVETGSYLFNKETNPIRKKYRDAFSVYSYPTRHDIYNRWDDIFGYAKKNGYDYIEHTTEDPSAEILFPEIIALHPAKTLKQIDKEPI